jgi:VWFA-related protein
MSKLFARLLALATGPLALAAVLGASPQIPASPQVPSSPQTPKTQVPPVEFSSRVELVLVDVNAVDAQNRPIEGLGPRDFTVKVDGEPRKVVAANYVPYPTPGEAKKAAGARSAADEAQAEFSSNQTQRAGPERLVIIAVDENNIRAGGALPVMRAAGRFLDSLQPNDRVGLIAFPAGQRVEVTNNHQAVKDALTRISGHGQARSSRHYVTLSEAFQITNGNQAVYNEVFDRECILAVGSSRQGSMTDLGAADLNSCRTEVAVESQQIVAQTMQNGRTTLQVIRQLVRSLRDVEGPKTLVLVSESLPLDDRGELLGEIMDTAADASAGRVTLYGVRIDPPPIDVSSVASLGSTSLQTSSERSFLFAGFETLVSASRGAVFSATGQGDNAFGRVALEMSGYYLLGLEPAPGDRDGKSHRIEVSVARPGAQLRARREFTVRSPGYRGGESDQAVLSRVLQSPYFADEFPVSVTTFAVRDAKTSRVRILVGADIDADANDPADYAVGLTVRDRRGAVVSTFLQRLRLQPRGTLAPRAYSASVPVEPGDYVVKLALRDSSGRLASVERPVAARFAAVGPFDSGALVVADEEKDGAAKWHPSVDGTVRGTTLAAYVELHAADRQAFDGVAASLEVAESAEGPVLLSTPLVLEADSEEKRVAFGRVDVRLLPPGRYQVRAMASRGHEPGRLVRPFVVPPSSSLFAARAVAARSPVAPFAAVGRPFDLSRVLAPDTIRPFLQRLTPAGRTLSGPSKAAVDLALAGKLASIADKLPAAPGSLDVCFLRGISLLARHDLEKAAGEFRSALRVQNDFFPAAFYLASCYAAGGRDKEAAAGFATALAGESDLRPAYPEAVDAAVRLGHWEHARDLAKEALAQWPDDPQVVRMAIAADVMTGHPVESYQATARYLQAHADDHEALFLALRLVALGQDKAGRGEGTVDRAAFGRYAQQYAAAKGPHQALVSLWARQVVR